MKKILVIDDSEMIRRQLNTILVEAGYKVEFAEDGAQGIQLFEKNTDASMIITDLNMPIMDGIMMIEKIRSLPSGRKIPIFVLTTEVSAAVKAKAKELGVAAWITKPMKTENLLSGIKKTLS